VHTGDKLNKINKQDQFISRDKLNKIDKQEPCITWDKIK